MMPYVPVTSLILSVARSRICEASKYLSSSEGVLKLHRTAVEELTKHEPNYVVEGGTVPRKSSKIPNMLK